MTRAINNYELIRRLGRGGMGDVFLAEHKVLGRRVAIKLLMQELSNDGALVQRFFNEAKAAATARHPGIVEIEDVGYDEGQAFIIMELIDGVTLADKVYDEGRLSVATALELTRQIAEALGAAHERGIVHRDLKPNNVMLVTNPDTGRLAIKVFDFGIAKLFGDDSSHTKTGVVIGTPLFMSPEQCKGLSSVDYRSDLYALGCMLFYMLTGQPVFDCEGDGDLIAHHIMVAPNPPSSLAAVPSSVDAIVMRLLEKRPEHRFQTVQELSNALSASLEEQLGETLAQLSSEDAMGAGPYPEPPRQQTPMPHEGFHLVPQTRTPMATSSRPAPGGQRLLWPTLGGVGLIAALGAALLLGPGESKEGAEPSSTPAASQSLEEGPREGVALPDELGDADEDARRVEDATEAAAEDVATGELENSQAVALDNEPNAELVTAAEGEPRPDEDNAKRGDDASNSELAKRRKAAEKRSGARKNKRKTRKSDNRRESKTEPSVTIKPQTLNPFGDE